MKLWLARTSHSWKSKKCAMPSKALCPYSCGVKFHRGIHGHYWRSRLKSIFKLTRSTSRLYQVYWNLAGWYTHYAFLSWWCGRIKLLTGESWLQQLTFISNMTLDSSNKTTIYNWWWNKGRSHTVVKQENKFSFDCFPNKSEIEKYRLGMMGGKAGLKPRISEAALFDIKSRYCTLF